MEPDLVPSSGTPAAYGRACSNCARAKAKCITGSGADAKCQRCHRLDKDCQHLQTNRRRRTVNRPSGTKTERLEAKLDGLYKLLQSSTSSTSVASQNIPASTVTSSTQPSPESLQSLGHTPKDGGESTKGPRALVLVHLNSSIGTVPQLMAYAFIRLPPLQMSQPSSDEAEESLNIFRSRMTTYFPFIIVPESTKAGELRRDRPFLWLCIMSIASKFTKQQKALGKEMKIMMGREILVEGKNNLDLLLGLLVFVAWGHYHIYDKPIIIQTTQLAMALVGNLGLNKPPPKEPTQTMLNLDARGCPIKPFSPSIRTMEERRAVLCCFLRSSVVSSYFQRLDALRWSPYLDECIAVLVEKEEYPTDALLIHLVKLQLVTENLGKAPWHQGPADATDSARAPPTFYLKVLQAQLQDFKVKIPPEIQRNDLLLLHIYSTELNIHEIALSKASVVNSQGFQRLDSLYACLHATKSWVDLFLSIPTESVIGFSIPIFTQMAHCIILLFRLLTFDDPLWDRELARNTANLTLILGQVIQKLMQVRDAADLDRGASEDENIFSGTARTLEAIKTWWDVKSAAESTDNMASDETLGDLNVDLFDDVWLKDILGQEDGHLEMNMQW